MSVPELDIIQECVSPEDAARVLLAVYGTKAFMVIGNNIVAKAAEHPFTPHITRQYSEPGEPGPEPLDGPLSFTAGTVSLVVAGQRQDFAMGERKDVSSGSPAGGPPLGFAPIQRGVGDEEEDEETHEDGEIAVPAQRIPLEPRRVPRQQGKADAGSAGAPVPVPSAPPDGRGDSSDVRVLPDERHHQLRLGAWENALANLLRQHFTRQERVVTAKLSGSKLRERWAQAVAAKPQTKEWDEADHPRGDDGRFGGGGWTKVTPDEKASEARAAAEATGPEGQNPDVAEMMARRDDHDTYRKNGATASFPTAGKGAISPEDQKRVLDALDGINRLYPDHPVGVTVSWRANIAHGLGATPIGGSEIVLSPDALQPEYQSNWDVDNATYTPAASSVPWMQYLMTHEFGHTMDRPQTIGRSPDTQKALDTLPAPSAYGDDGGREKFAEAFAEWHLSQGTTKDPLATALAKSETWHDFNEQKSLESKRAGTIEPVMIAPPVKAENVFDKAMWQDALKADTSGMLSAIWDDFGQDAAQTYGIDWTMDTPDIEDAIGNQLAGLLHIEDTTEGQIGRALEQGFNRGDDHQSLIGAIEAIFANAQDLRAPLIAQQQAVAAGNGAIVNLGRQSDGEFTSKTWVSQEDDRVRPTHQDADGQTVPIDDPFEVGEDLLMYPGDPSGSLGEVLNCRCFSRLSPPTVTEWTPPSVDERAAQDIVLGKTIPVFAVKVDTGADWSNVQVKFVSVPEQPEPEQKWNSHPVFQTSVKDWDPAEGGIPQNPAASVSVPDELTEGGVPLEAKDWDPDVHPRGPDGRFGDSGGAASEPATDATITPIRPGIDLTKPELSDGSIKPAGAHFTVDELQPFVGKMVQVGRDPMFGQPDFTGLLLDVRKNPVGNTFVTVRNPTEVGASRPYQSGAVDMGSGPWTSIREFEAEPEPLKNGEVRMPLGEHFTADELRAFIGRGVKVELQDGRPGDTMYGHVTAVTEDPDPFYAPVVSMTNTRFEGQSIGDANKDEFNYSTSAWAKVTVDETAKGYQGGPGGLWPEPSTETTEEREAVFTRVAADLARSGSFMNNGLWGGLQFANSGDTPGQWAAKKVAEYDSGKDKAGDITFKAGLIRKLLDNPKDGDKLPKGRNEVQRDLAENARYYLQNGQRQAEYAEDAKKVGTWFQDIAKAQAQGENLESVSPPALSRDYMTDAETPESGNGYTKVGQTSPEMATAFVAKLEGSLSSDGTCDRLGNLAGSDFIKHDQVLAAGRQVAAIIDNRNDVKAAKQTMDDARANREALNAKAHDVFMGTGFSGELDQVHADQDVAGDVHNAAKTDYSDTLLRATIEEVAKVRPLGGKLSVRADNRVLGDRVRDAASVYPADWVQQVNNIGAVGVSGDTGDFNGRGFHSSDGIHLDLDNDNNGTTAVHELMHHMEDSIPGVKVLEAADWRTRTAGQDAKGLTELQPTRGYKESELTIPDGYADAYMGKMYSQGASGAIKDWGKSPAGRNSPFEIMSTAMGWMFGSAGSPSSAVGGRLMGIEPRSRVGADPETRALVLGALTQL